MKQIATRILLSEDQKLKDFQGDYEYYLSQNDVEAEKMAVKEERQEEIAKAQIKAKSKVGGGGAAEGGGGRMATKQGLPGSK